MFGNTWNNIIGWFKDLSERSRIIRSFNQAAKEAFIVGIAPTLLTSSISRGDSSYKHPYSHWLHSGFRIQAYTGRALGKDELIHIGNVILNDNSLIRKLVVLGFDTLEIHSDVGNYGCKWQLKDHIQLT
jgi:hypothetical protein